MRFASFLSGGFISAIVVYPPERKLAKRTSVHCGVCTAAVLIKEFRHAAAVSLEIVMKSCRKISGPPIVLSAITNKRSPKKGYHNKKKVAFCGLRSPMINSQVCQSSIKFFEFIEAH